MVKIVDLGVLEYDTPHQGHAGSCTIHSVVACIRAILELEGYLINPSVQDPINCCKSKGNNLEGWSFEDVLGYIKANGLTLESDYPFVGDHQTCLRHHPTVLPRMRPRIRIYDYRVCRVKSAKQLKQLLGRGFPICVSMFIGPEFQAYTGGLFDAVYTDDSQVGVELHAMVLTAYNDVSFKAKNSYGSAWGENGFIFIELQQVAKFVEMAYITGVDRM